MTPPRLPASAEAASTELVALISELQAAATIVSARAQEQGQRAAFLAGALEQAAQSAWGGKRRKR